MRTIYTTENIASIIAAKRPDYVYVSGEVATQASNIQVRHKPCGRILTVKVKGFLSLSMNGFCKFCSPAVNPVSTSNRPLTEDDIKKRFSEKFPDGEYTYISDFMNTKSKMKVLHKNCGTVFNVTSHMFFGSKASRCPHCANFRRKDHQAVNRKPDYLNTLLIDASLNDDYYWMEEYTGDNKYKHLIFHKVCGQRSLIRPNDVQQGYLPCMCEGSKYEVQFKKLLEKHGIEYQREFKLGGNSMRIDFVVVLNNQKYFIEVDGEYHEQFASTIKNDEIKNEYVAKHYPDVKLIRVKYNDDFEAIILDLKGQVLPSLNRTNCRNDQTNITTGAVPQPTLKKKPKFSIPKLNLPKNKYSG